MVGHAAAVHVIAKSNPYHGRKERLGNPPIQPQEWNQTGHFPLTRNPPSAISPATAVQPAELSGAVGGGSMPNQNPSTVYQSSPHQRTTVQANPVEKLVVTGVDENNGEEFNRTSPNPADCVQNGSSFRTNPTEKSNQSAVRSSAEHENNGKRFRRSSYFNNRWGRLETISAADLISLDAVQAMTAEEPVELASAEDSDRGQWKRRYQVRSPHRSHAKFSSSILVPLIPSSPNRSQKRIASLSNPHFQHKRPSTTEPKDNASTKCEEKSELCYRTVQQPNVDRNGWPQATEMSDEMSQNKLRTRIAAEAARVAVIEDKSSENVLSRTSKQLPDSNPNECTKNSENVAPEEKVQTTMIVESAELASSEDDDSVETNTEDKEESTDMPVDTSTLRVDKLTAQKLAAADWQLSFSSTAKNEYYFNTRTAESSTCVPDVQNVQIPCYDDEMSEDEEKKENYEFIDEIFYDPGTVPTYVWVAKQQQQYDMFHPHQEAEIKRSCLFHQLSKAIDKAEAIPFEKNELKELLLTQKLCHGEGQDPFFPTRSGRPCRALIKEIRRKLGPLSPVRRHAGLQPGVTMDEMEAEMNLKIIQQMLQSRRGSPEKLQNPNQAELKDLATRAGLFYCRYSKARSDVEERAKLLDYNFSCGQFLLEVSEKIAEGILRICGYMGKMLYQKNVSLLRPREPTVPPCLSHEPIEEITVTRPAILTQPCVRLSYDTQVVKVKSDGRNRLFVSHEGYVQEINSNTERKLRFWYQKNCEDDFQIDQYLERLFCLLKRYYDFTNLEDSEWSLNPHAMRSLNREFEVSFECFASPLNSFFKQFCSPFPDTDGYFGSRGSFFDFRPISGSFVVNPPLREELLQKMVDHIEGLLKGATYSLSFIVVIHWIPRIMDQVVKQLSTSKHLRYRMKIPEAKAVRGDQHIFSGNDALVPLKHRVVGFFLQNEAGYKRWTPTEEKVEIVRTAFAAEL